jgi:acetyl-CoA synthetase
VSSDPRVAAWRRAATDDPEKFWGEAAEALPWFKKWERVLDWEPPTFRWYQGGRSNLAYNCVDHHVQAGRGDRLALITENERGDKRRYTYAELLAETKRVSAALRGIGIEKGDRIAIYMPTSAEAIILMLGAIRIGAVILVVFAGFGSGALASASGWPVHAPCSRPTSPTARARTSRSRASSTTRSRTRQRSRPSSCCAAGRRRSR